MTSDNVGRRVLILDTGDPRSPSGGQSTFVRNVVAGSSWNVHLGVPTHEPLSSNGTAVVGGREVGVTRLADSGTPGRRPLIPLRLRCLLGAIARVHSVARECDVAYVHSAELLLPPLLLWRLPVVFHLHGAASPLSVSRYQWARNSVVASAYWRVVRRLIRRADLVLSVDAVGRSVCIVARGGDAGCEVLPVCFDSKLFFPRERDTSRASLGLGNREHAVVFVGRLEEAKGTALLLDTMLEIRNRGRRCTLLVVGDGTQRSVLEGKAARLGLDVIFTGWLPSERLPEYLSACDALILPSVAEGLPTVVLESLACGTPVVATRVGGVPDLVRDWHTGRLVEELTPSSWGDAVCDVLDGIWSVKAISQSVSEYSMESVCRRLDAALDRVLEHSLAGTGAAPNDLGGM